MNTNTEMLFNTKFDINGFDLYYNKLSKHQWNLLQARLERMNKLFKSYSKRKNPYYDAIVTVEFQKTLNTELSKIWGLPGDVGKEFGKYDGFEFNIINSEELLAMIDKYKE